MKSESPQCYGAHVERVMEFGENGSIGHFFVGGYEVADLCYVCAILLAEIRK